MGDYVAKNIVVATGWKIVSADLMISGTVAWQVRMLVLVLGHMAVNKCCLR